MIIATSSGDTMNLEKIVLNYGTKNDLKQKYPFIVHLLNIIKNEVIIRYSLKKKKNDFKVGVSSKEQSNISSYMHDPILRLNRSIFGDKEI